MIPVPRSSLALDPPLRRFAGWFSAALLALAMVGCGRRDWIADYPDVAERARQEPSAFVDPAFEQWQGVQGIAGSYGLVASRGIGRASADIWVAANRPDKLLLEVLTPTGTTEGFLTANGEEVGLWTEEEGVLYRGPLEGNAFRRALGLPLDLEDAIALLLGFGVDRDRRPPASVVWDDRQKRIRLDFDASVSLWLHPVLLRFQRLRYTGGDTSVQAEIENWTDQPAPIPRRLRLDLEKEGLHLDLRLHEEWTLNPDFTPRDFSIRTPLGAVEMPLEALATDGGLLRRN